VSGAEKISRPNGDQAGRGFPLVSRAISIAPILTNAKHVISAAIRVDQRRRAVLPDVEQVVEALAAC
jgi:hypothetical protein